MNVTKFDIFKNSRLALGLALFIIALTSASLISKEANRSVLVWASTGALAPGQVIEQSDVTTASVLLAQSAKNYLSTNAQIIGTTVLTSIASGESNSGSSTWSRD
jgi:flagella basal body P-ring formation protein FlgA